MDGWTIAILTIIGLTTAGKCIYLFLQHHAEEAYYNNACDWDESLDEDLIPIVNQAISTIGTVIGPANYYANVRHGQRDNWFQFSYEKNGTEWLAFIERMPSLNGRDPNCHLTHRYHNSSTGRYWICYEPQPRNLHDCQNLSRIWADRLCEYISTGIPFEEQKW